jgi:hypothetical protein
MHTLAWRERAHGLAPAGLVAGGVALPALLRELGRRDAASLPGLSVLATPSLLVLLGDAERLPWVDGVAYCAPEPEAPGLWLPTRLAPNLPPDLLHAALRRRAGDSRLLLWPEPALVLGLDGALPLQPGVLDWLNRELA